MSRNIEIIDLNELKLDVEYSVKKYRRSFGTTGIVFTLQISENNIEKYIQIKEGPVHEYLKHKNDKTKFTIMRTSKNFTEPQIIIDNMGKWVNLTSVN